MYLCNDAIEDFATVKMAPPLDWNPNGNYLFDDSLFDMSPGSGKIHVRRKRGGAGVKNQISDAALQFNSAQANTAAPPGNSVFCFILV